MKVDEDDEDALGIGTDRTPVNFLWCDRAAGALVSDVEHIDFVGRVFLLIQPWACESSVGEATDPLTCGRNCDQGHNIWDDPTVPSEA